MFDNKKIMEAAKKLGLEIELNSKEPGFYLKDTETNSVNYFDFSMIADKFSRLFRNDAKKKSKVTFEEKIIINRNLDEGNLKNFKTNYFVGKDYPVSVSKQVNIMKYNTGVDLPDGINQFLNKTDKAA